MARLPSVGQPEPGKAGSRIPLTSFVGRAREVAELTGLLRDRRLVTITGPGGVGKTRLAVEVAGGVAGQFPDGVHFVGLGAVATEARVAAEVAAVLGVRQVPGRSPREALAAMHAPLRLLLVLDNCEHVLAATAELCGELLRAADDVRILATSREQLWVGAEVRYRLAPLGLPGPGGPAEGEVSAAVALFADRARQADPGFVLTPQSAPLAADVMTAIRTLSPMPIRYIVNTDALREHTGGNGTLSGCSDKANTGGSGTFPPSSVEEASGTITWNQTGTTDLDNFIGNGVSPSACKRVRISSTPLIFSLG